jgi:hypothetical protein
VASTASAQQEFTPVAGGVRYRKIGVCDQARLAAILDRELDTFMAGSDPSQASTTKSTDFKSKCATPRNGVTLYEVHFNSVIPEWDNQPALGSGLLAVPDDGGTSHPLVSYQHGTVFGRDQVPTRPDNSYETRLALAAFASQGYVVIGADYFGLGPSRVASCFIVPRGTTQSMFDHYLASRAVLESRGRALCRRLDRVWFGPPTCKNTSRRRLAASYGFVRSHAQERSVPRVGSRTTAFSCWKPGNGVGRRRGIRRSGDFAGSRMGPQACGGRMKLTTAVQGKSRDRVPCARRTQGTAVGSLRRTPARGCPLRLRSPRGCKTG